MERKNEDAKRSARGIDAGPEQDARSGWVIEAGRQLIARVALLGVLILAAVFVGCLVSSCGGHQDEHAAASGAGPAMVVAQAPGATASTRGAGIPAEGAALEGSAVVSADSLPPDVAASVADTLVYPGASVELVAEGSPDVVAVTLTDGLGRKQPFAYDEKTDMWRVLYRVPMRAGSDRLGLSVTARTASYRWRRVWLFLHVEREGAALPDSAQSR